MARESLLVWTDLWTEDTVIGDRKIRFNLIGFDWSMIGKIHSHSAKNIYILVIKWEQ